MEFKFRINCTLRAADVCIHSNVKILINQDLQTDQHGRNLNNKFLKRFCSMLKMFRQVYNPGFVKLNLYGLHVGRVRLLMPYNYYYFFDAKYLYLHQLFNVNIFDQLCQ